MADLTNAQKKEWAKNFVPQGKPHTAGNRRPGGGVTGVRVQLGTGREVGGTEGGAYAHKAGTGG